ncbi:MAG TPA: pyridoxamine 5'-phosphate oxidase [Pyrinomonadaceae bacterium]|nr:pyridoxamine 5'-phosphate oxidase [Pyrinomonadaceae bacterium]
MNRIDLANLRRDYAGEPLSKASVDRDPFVQFGKWLNEALDAEITDANAMTVATVNRECRPSARIVLLKGYDKRGFVFFTNYESEKARNLAANPETVLSFFWPQLQRQIMIYGAAGKTSREESESYFKSRPYDSQIAAWASAQSSVIESRAALEKKFAEMRERLGEDVPLPPFWGGFRVVPDRFEFWQGRASRLHDRIVYRLSDGDWNIERLSP